MERSKLAAQALWGSAPAGADFGGEARVGTKEFFEAVLAKRSTYEQPWLRELVPFPTFSGKRVLEVGSGAGYDAYEICRRGARYTGIDIALANAARTRTHLACFGLEPRVANADAERLPFRDGSFDVVFSNGVLHHTPDMPASFREIRRVLRPGGALFVVLYHRDSIVHWLRIFLADWLLLGGFRARTFREQLSLVESATSTAARPLVNVYTRASLRRALRGAGFDVRELAVRKLVREDFPDVYWAWLLWDRLPASWLERIGRRFGWYLIARATRS